VVDNIRIPVRGISKYVVDIRLPIKGTVSRDFLLLVFFLNQFPPASDYTKGSFEFACLIIFAFLLKVQASRWLIFVFLLKSHVSIVLGR
jgi:hypothetical protein